MKFHTSHIRFLLKRLSGIALVGLLLGYGQLAFAQENHAPVALVTVSSTVTTLDESVIIDGRKSYDPDDDALAAFEWELLSGPKPVDFQGQEAAVWQFSTDTAGLYTFQLTVTDEPPVFDPMSSSTNITIEVLGEAGCLLGSGSCPPLSLAGWALALSLLLFLRPRRIRL